MADGCSKSTSETTGEQSRRFSMSISPIISRSKCTYRMESAVLADFRLCLGPPQVCRGCFEIRPDGQRGSKLQDGGVQVSRLRKKNTKIVVGIRVLRIQANRGLEA